MMPFTNDTRYENKNQVEWMNAINKFNRRTIMIDNETAKLMENAKTNGFKKS
jgi:hypothetical protein